MSNQAAVPFSEGSVKVDTAQTALRLWKPVDVMPELQPYFQGHSVEELKTLRVTGPERIYSFSRKPSLDDHCRMLALEFVGRFELELYNALLTVLIRRELGGTTPVERFLRLWNEEADFLASHLDSRWLISACDTLVDHAPDGAERALALTVVLTLNTIKLYETERLLQRERAPEAIPSSVAIQGRVPLFDGMSAFTVGQGDMVANLYCRVSRVAHEQGGAAGRILQEMLARLKAQPTVYKRFLDRHENPLTVW